jgi:hypothetical protein
MKFLKPALFAVVLGAVTLAAGKVSAFPLYLTSFNGTISCTRSYSAIQNTNVAKISKVAFTLKNVMTVVSNQVYLNTVSPVPANVKIAYDPYRDVTFLTNATGFYYNLDGIVITKIDDLATSFKGTNTGGSESDVALVSLDVVGHGTDGSLFEAKISGQGSLNYSISGINPGKMSLSLSGGGGYGELQNSDDGVTKGGFTFSGTGNPEWSTAFSLWWY